MSLYQKHFTLSIIKMCKKISPCYLTIRWRNEAKISQWLFLMLLEVRYATLLTSQIAAGFFSSARLSTLNMPARVVSYWMLSYRHFRSMWPDFGDYKVKISLDLLLGSFVLCLTVPFRGENQLTNYRKTRLDLFKEGERGTGDWMGKGRGIFLHIFVFRVVLLLIGGP